MPAIFPPVHLYPEIYNTDRNVFTLWGGTHTWLKDNDQWSFDNTCYLQWLSNRYKSNVTLNQIAPQTVTLFTNQVAYVALNLLTEGAVLPIAVTDGDSLPKGDNIVMIAMRASYLVGEPLLLRGGIYVQDNGTFSTAGVRNQYVGIYSGVTWTITHNLNSENVIVELRNSQSPPQRIFSEVIEYIDANTVVATFNASVTGKAIVMKGVV